MRANLNLPRQMRGCGQLGRAKGEGRHHLCMRPRLRVSPSELGDMPLFSTTEAEERGISRHDLTTMLLRGLIWRVARGWYSSRMDSRLDEQHLLRTAANLRLQGPSAVVCRQSAALLHDLPLARTDLEIVELSKVSAGHGRTREGVRLSVLSIPPERCVDVEIPIVGGTAKVVDPATAIVGTAMTANPIAALVAGDEALRLGACTREEIEWSLEHYRGCKGIDAARKVLEHLEPRHESPGETLSAAVLRRGAWDFDPQVEVWANGRLYRLDFALREYRVALEFDGEIKYTGPEVMEAQLRREADLRAAGWVVVRFVWADLEDEFVLRQRIHAAIAEARAAA